MDVRVEAQHGGGPAHPVVSQAVDWIDFTAEAVPHVIDWARRSIHWSRKARRSHPPLQAVNMLVMEGETEKALARSIFRSCVDFSNIFTLIFPCMF